LRSLSAAAAILVFLVAAPFLLSRASAEPAPGPAGTGGRAQLPEDAPEFKELLERLAARAALYRKYALGFTCRESVVEAKYNLQTSTVRKDEKTIYDYLFEERPNGSLREFRERLIEKNGDVKRRSTDYEPPVPPAYMWTSLFAAENKNRFHFRPAGQVVKAYRLLTLIDFIGTAPNPGGNTIYGWSGQVALEARSLNIWSLTAVPSGQDRRLEVEILRYRKAFAIAGVPLASRPHGRTLEVLFGMEPNSLSYPTEQTLVMTSLTQDQKMDPEAKTTFKYEDYRFFEVATEEEMKETSGS